VIGDDPLLVLLCPSGKSGTTFKPQILDPHMSLAKQSVTSSSIVYLVPCKVWPLSTRVVLAAPGKDKPLKPPAAFRKKVRVPAWEKRAMERDCHACSEVSRREMSTPFTTRSRALRH